MDFLFNNLQQHQNERQNKKPWQSMVVTQKNILLESNYKNKRDENTQVDNTSQKQYTRLPNHIFRQFPLYHLPPPIQPNNPIIEKETPKDEIVMSWGKPTWFLFHTLAEKVYESKFFEIRAGLLDSIYSICLNLPCPKCAEHAKQHLNGINFNTIRTKEDLKMLLFDFHNYVNSVKKYDIFKYEDLVQYKNAITKNIIYNFLIEYNRKSKNIRYLADDLHREKIAVSLKKWFANNIQYFEN